MILKQIQSNQSVEEKMEIDLTDNLNRQLYSVTLLGKMNGSDLVILPMK